MAEFVAKGDDFRALADGGKELGVSLGELLQGFANDHELSFHGRTDQSATAVLIKVYCCHSSLNGLASI
jgi:hypothetical protein